MFTQIKIFIITALTAAIALFIWLFKARGTKIEELNEKLNASKRRYEERLKTHRYETRMRAKREEYEKEDYSDNPIADGTYRL